MAEHGDFVGPPANRYESLGHIVEEARTRGTFEVRDRERHLVGWIVRRGRQFEARGVAADLDTSSALGLFHSGRAALRLVIGYREYDAVRRATREQAAKFEREYLAAHPEILPTTGASRPAPEPQHDLSSSIRRRSSP
ncbi:MAG: hypothetical protein DI536_35825 [Archangium gephyra]|uniref:Uncharacterized protein n=1 Tax=Archangium gephyra TaxID=48 RepID=A0A2W5SVW6_9BACT|nr:MAG: hypothetical protein DI536_35825 [Archangium gephyra]